MEDTENRRERGPFLTLSRFPLLSLSEASLLQTAKHTNTSIWDEH